MKIIAVLPYLSEIDTKGIFIPMYQSFDLTRSKNTILVMKLEKGCITKFINDAFMEHPDADFYHIMNHDTIYKTTLWDLKLAQKGKITYGDDGFQGENLPTFPMIDGDIVRALGWLQMPTLNRYCGDVVWKHIGTQLGILEYVPEVKITHHWEGADEEINRQDTRAFAQWLPWSFKDINKVREGTRCEDTESLKCEK